VVIRKEFQWVEEKVVNWVEPPAGTLAEWLERFLVEKMVVKTVDWWEMKKEKQYIQRNRYMEVGQSSGGSSDRTILSSHAIVDLL
jgi:hypothetical protein